MSQLQVNQINDASGGVLAPISSVMRNRIINGAMVIDQRNAGASFTPTTANGYSLDRWVARITQNSKLTIQQNAGSVTPPVGFSNYLGVTSSSAYSVLTGDTFLLAQVMEGFNIADLGWGTANAKSITISFWVRSSLTGTFGGALVNGSSNRSYAFNYTINAANTWEYETITIVGDTSGTWATNNTAGIELRFGLGSGSAFTGTAGAWGAGNLVQPTGTVSVVGTNGATFYITGVQLEKGTQATSFEYRQYQQELALCQRYYYRVAPSATSKMLSGGGLATGITAGTGFITFPVTMRTSPTALEQSGTASDYAFLTATGGIIACSSVPTFNATTDQYYALVAASVSSGLVTGSSTVMFTNSATGYLGWSAEL
jgi:hypothetical protein